MTLRDLVDAGALVAVDTAPFIYYIEGGSRFDAIAVELFEGCIATGRNPAMTTVVTLAEVLVGAFRAGQRDIAGAYRDVLQQSGHVEMHDLDPMIAERAADLRARYDLRLPDALQVAAALVSGAGYFITNDTRVRRVTEIEVIVLADVS